MRIIAGGKYILITAMLIAAGGIFSFFIRREKIDYNSQVKPIFNKKCITCHGGVRRKAGFSLLFRSEALAPNESGKPAIIPGDPDQSEMIRRLTLADPEERMPYKHDPLSSKEISVLKQWIRQGAIWGNHWAYSPVQNIVPPKPNSFFGLFSSDDTWAKNEIDYFILEKLRENELAPSPEADKATLLRRVSLDLIGMPAPKNISSKFLKDSSDRAYENLVNDLLSSLHFGERWASMWLDLARYADTKGYEADQARMIWKYRDWLIRAFNDDKPYNTFLIEQLAGDLLPSATDDQFIATAFHRNSMTNDEGGTDNEEFRTAAVIDRVNTTWEALMGTTFGCVQCHSHPYDPFKHEEYYKFLAFFNNSRDEDTQADYPLLRQFSSGDSNRLAQLTTWLKASVSTEKASEINTFLRTWQPSYNSIVCDEYNHAALVSSWYAGLQNNGSCRLQRADLEGKDELILRYNSNRKNGELIIYRDSLHGTILKKIRIDTTKNDWKIISLSIPLQEGIHDIFFKYLNPLLGSTEETGILLEWIYFTNKFPGNGKPGFDSAFKRYNDLLRVNATITTPVMFENAHAQNRNTHVFERGNWMVKGNKVLPGVPSAFPPMASSLPGNRLGLAQWITSKENPLTARTLVNRCWEQLFGAGLAETLEDLGTQGIPPSHPELLNWLAYHFMNTDNWSIKKTLKRMVMSAVYRQDSKSSAQQTEKDPQNKWLSRSSRIRLSAEQIRDQALYASGLLSEKMYGPSVMPYQPEGIWLSPWSGQFWIKSEGEDQYRRAIYTFWKRTAPYPSMMTFDGAAREVCTARRIRTNTPLQALVTLNDEVYLEASRHFAYRVKKESGPDPSSQISAAYFIATGHPIRAKSLSSLVSLYQSALGKFRSDKDKTCEMIGVMDENNNPETAALVVVTSAILNLDEVITKN